MPFTLPSLQSGVDARANAHQVNLNRRPPNERIARSRSDIPIGRPTTRRVTFSLSCHSSDSIRMRLVAQGGVGERQAGVCP